MQRARATPTKQSRSAPVVEDIHAFINLQTREKFERNALMIEEKTNFSDLIKRVIEMPVARGSARSTSLPGLRNPSGGEKNATPPREVQRPVSKEKSNTASSPQYQLKNPAELVRRDQMAWETYEIRSREMRRVRDDADDMIPRPSSKGTTTRSGNVDSSSPPRSPRTTDSLPSDAQEFEDDALFAARNLRLMHARRRRVEGHTKAQTQSKPPTSFPPLGRASTPQQPGRRSSTPTMTGESLPRLSSPAERQRRSSLSEIALPLHNEEGLQRSTIQMEEQACRAPIEKKFKLQSKLVNSGEKLVKPRKATSPPPRPEYEKQMTSLQKDEMKLRLGLTDAESAGWSTIWSNCMEGASLIIERSHRVRAHTEIAEVSGGVSAHAKATAHLDARRGSHKKALATACMLIIDEEDLEREDLHSEWEEFFQLQVLEPYYARRVANLGIHEAKTRRDVENLYAREFERSVNMLRKYLDIVEPFVLMHRLDCEELLKHSSSAILLLNHTSAQRSIFESEETTARSLCLGLQSETWSNVIADELRLRNLILNASIVFSSFHLEKSLLACTESEAISRAIVSEKQGVARLALLDQQQYDVEGAAQFREWYDVADEIYNMEMQHKQMMFDIHRHALFESALMQRELRNRRALSEHENAARTHMFRVEGHLSRLVEHLDDMVTYAKREFHTAKNDLLHKSAEFKTLPAEIQELARRVREGDRTLTSFVVHDAAAYTPTDFARLLDFLRQAPVPLQKVSIRCGSSHALSLYEANPVELELIECGLEDIDGSSLSFLEFLSHAACRLESLVLDGNDLTDMTIRKYLRVLKFKNHKLRKLSVKENVDVPENLQNALSYLSELNQYTESFKRLMIRAQENDATLRTIDMGEFVAQQSVADSTGKLYPTGDACIRLMCLSLQNNTNCTSLNVSRFGVSENGARNLATLIRTNSNIVNVNVSYNNIGIAGVAQIAQAAATASQKTKVLFYNNYTAADVEREEALARRTRVVMFEEFQWKFWLAFAEVSEGRTLRLNQTFDKKQQILSKYEAPFVRAKLLEEHHERQRRDFDEDETALRDLIEGRQNEDISKLRDYFHQRMKEVDRISADRASLLLFHMVVLEQELERSSTVTLIEKILRGQSLFDAEFWFRHLKVVEEHHENLIGILQHHSAECLDYYIASEAEVMKIAEVLARQPYAIRDVIFSEKLKMMQRMDAPPLVQQLYLYGTPIPTNAAPTAALTISRDPPSAAPTIQTVPVLQPTQTNPTPMLLQVPPPAAPMMVASSPSRSDRPSASNRSAPSPLHPAVISESSPVRRSSMSPVHQRNSPMALPPQIRSPMKTSSGTGLILSPQLPHKRVHNDTTRVMSSSSNAQLSIDALISSRDGYNARPDPSDFPVTDESIQLMHDIICNGGAPVDRVSLAYRGEHVHFMQSMHLIEHMSEFIELLDLSGCKLNDDYLPAILRIITNPESRLRVFGLKDNAFSLQGVRTIVHELKNCHTNLEAVHLGHDDDAVQMTSQLRRLRDLARFYLAMKGTRVGRFKNLLVDVEADEPHIKVLDFSHAIQLKQRRRRESSSHKKLRKVGTPSTRRASPGGSGSPDRGGHIAPHHHSPGTSSGEELHGETDSPAIDVDDIDEGVLTEDIQDIPPPLGDEDVQLICFALSSNTHVFHLSLRGNNITDNGGKRVLKYLREHGDETPLQWIDIRDNYIDDVIVAEVEAFFQKRWSKRFESEVFSVESQARKELQERIQYDEAFIPINRAFLHAMKEFSSLEGRWYDVHSNVYDFFVAKGRMDLAVVDPEIEQRKVREAITAQFHEKARVYLMLLNFRSEKYVKYCAQKQQIFQEEEVMTDRVGRMILSLDPNLQAVAVHIARDNKFVDSLDLSSTPLEPRCSDDVIAVMTGLMKQNTHVKEVSFSNSGGYFNAHRSMPLIAEMGVRLETLDLTNCHLADAHVGALAAMLQTPECSLETLVLDDNYISSVGARKLAKAIRASKTLSCVSVSKNSNTSVEDLKLLQFYCDLNKFTPHFKETILRVEANDPALTELHFDRRGNLNERCVFDDVSMRLLCAALPHNTHVERIFLAGNHVSDEGAICLLNLLKSKVNRSVYVVDLSGNDVSPALVDELSRLVLIRLGETIEQTVYNPEEISRAAILHDDRGFWFWLERLKHIAVGWREMVQSCEHQKDFEIGRSFHDAHLDYHVMQYERHGRKLIEDEERMFGEVSEYVHDSVVRGYQPVVLDYLRAMRRTFMNGQQEIEDLIEELDRQPNLDLRRNALYILNNMRKIESLDLSSTLPSDFCEQEILCNGRTVDIALRILPKNKTVKRLNLANNDGRVPGWNGIWPLSHRLQFLDVSRCGLTDAEVPAICHMISDPLSTLTELILDGNLFSEVGCMDILRTLRHNAETRANFPLKKISILECPHVSENLISMIEFVSDLLRCAPGFRDLMLRLRFGTEEMRTVDAQEMEITDDLCKLLCVALKNHKSVKAIKLRRNRITDIGVDYLCRLVKSNPSIEYVDVSENDISSVARRQLASLLEDRLGKRLGNDVQLPEEFHREDIVYEESMFPRFFWHYNKLSPNVFRHYERAVDMFVNYCGRFWGIEPVFRPENDARRGGVEVAELQQRMLLYKWMQYHQWIVSFKERTHKQKKQWLSEGETAIRELRGLVASHPSRELREKAFKIALNSPNVVAISLVQQCDEDAVVVLGKVLKGNTYLKEINLSGNHQIKPSWVLPLIAEANTNLEVLHLSDCNLRDGDIGDPLKGLLAASKCKLLKVILDRNFLTQNSIQRIVPVLRETNHILTEVSLKHNPELSRSPLHYLDFCLELNKYIGVGHEHGKREDYLKIKELLVQVEANRPSISTLNFVNDQYALLMLDDQFAKLVCIALAHNTHVRTLYIRGHQVTDRGAQYILQVLQGVNRSLDFVDLHGNFVSDSMLLAIEYAIPWRHYAADLDRLLESGRQALQNTYDHYESFYFSNKRDHQLMIIRPCFDARAEIEKSEDMVYRKLLNRYPEWLRFADAWHKSYKYAFQRTFLQAEETLPIDNTMVDSRLSRSISDAFSFRTPASPPTAGASKLLDAVTALKAQMLPDFLRQKYLKFVSLADLYEQKCVRNLEKVFAQFSPVSANATEQFLTSTYAAARIPSIFIAPDKASSSPGLRAVSSSERLGTPSPSYRRAPTPTVSFSDSFAPMMPDALATSGTFGSRVQSFVSPNRSSPPRQTSPPQPTPEIEATSSFGNFGSFMGSGSLALDGSMGRAPSMRRGSTGSNHFSSSQFADISGLDEEKLLMKLVARYERLNDQVLAYEGKCSQMIQNQFRLAANDLAFVGRNRKIHGPQCDERCVCAIVDTSVDAARKLHTRLQQRFSKFVTQVENFEDVCLSTVNAYYDESRLAVIELKKLLLRKSQSEIDAIKFLGAKLENRFERYVSTVDDFEKKCVAALQKAFDVHAAPVERSIEDALMKRQIVDERLAEASELHHKLHQRYLRYETVMNDFETKCRAAKERLVKPDLDAMVSSVAVSRREQMGSRERVSSVVFLDGDTPTGAGGLPTVKSFFSSPNRTNPAVVKLQARYERYKQSVEDFEKECMDAHGTVYEREKSKVQTGSTASFRRNSSVYGRDQSAANDMLNRAPSLRRIDSMAAIVSPDAKTEQALQLLPTQPQAMQRVGRLIANNDPNVRVLDLSSTSDVRPVNDTTIGLLFTLLRSNNQLKELNLANHGHNLTITSMKLLSRLGRKLEKLDLSNGMIENQLVVPTVCAMLSVPECTLTTLNLNNNKITQDGLLQIMQVLRKSNTSVTTISLQGNEGLDRGSISFLNFYCDLNRYVPLDERFKPMVLRAEKNDEGLSEILLKNVGYVDDLALRCMCIALAKNTNVSVINLSGNTISDKSIKHIVQVLSFNTSITRLDLSGNRFTSDGVTALRKAASESKVTHFIV